MAATGFILPFFFIFNPALLLRSDDIMGTVLSIGASILAILCFSYTIWGWCFTQATPTQRLLSGSASLAFALFIVFGQPLWFGIGLAALAAYWFWQKATAVQCAHPVQA